MKPLSRDTSLTSPAHTAGKVAPRPATIRSELLLGEADQLNITHAGRTYQLRRTRSGKLILTA